MKIILHMPIKKIALVSDEGVEYERLNLRQIEVLGIELIAASMKLKHPNCEKKKREVNHAGSKHTISSRRNKS